MKDGKSDRPFSMNNVKILCFNKLFLKRFFEKSGIDQTHKKISAAYEELLFFGKIAA